MPLIPKQQPPYYAAGPNPTPADQIKEYTIQLSQNGTSTPTPIIIANTIGTITWSRTSAGQYTATLINAFPIDKTYMIQSMQLLLSSAGGFLGYYRLWRTTNDTFNLYTYDVAQAPQDISTLFGNDTPFALQKIQVYV